MRQLGDLLDHCLARVVLRVRLAGEDELHRHLRDVDQRGERSRSLEDQVGALVGGEPAGEADGQRVEAERAARAARRASADSPRRSACAAARRRDEVDQLRLQRLVRLPQLAVVDVVDRVPDSGSLLRSGQSGPRWRS